MIHILLWLAKQRAEKQRQHTEHKVWKRTKVVGMSENPFIHENDPPKPPEELPKKPVKPRKTYEDW
jgi:hypothetical protein